MRSAKVDMLIILRENRSYDEPFDLRFADAAKSNNILVRYDLDHYQKENAERRQRREKSSYDGQFSNNDWLQELPKPMNKLTWDNPVLMGPAMADRIGIKTEDLVELELSGTKITAPVWIQVGHPDHSVTVFLGYGRRRAGRV